MNERIAELRKLLGLTQQEFGDTIGLKRNTIATYEMGKSCPSDRTVGDICDKFNVSEVWLRTGKGQPFIPVDKDQELQNIFSQIIISDDPLIRRIIKAYWELNKSEKEAIKKLINSLSEKEKTPD